MSRKRGSGCGKRSLRPRYFVCALCLLIAAAYGGLRAQRLAAYARSGMSILPLYQFSYPTTICRIGGEDKSVASSGCGAVCMSMAITYLTGNEEQTPQELFALAWENGDYFGYGLTHETISTLGRSYGISGTWVDRDAELIRTALGNGQPVIAHMGPGTFTREGHYILLRGLTSDGLVVLNDPNSKSRTREAYSLGLIMDEAKGEAPFMICGTAD